MILEVPAWVTWAAITNTSTSKCCCTHISIWPTFIHFAYYPVPPPSNILWSWWNPIRTVLNVVIFPSEHVIPEKIKYMYHYFILDPLKTTEWSLLHFLSNLNLHQYNDVTSVILKCTQTVFLKTILIYLIKFALHENIVKCVRKGWMCIAIFFQQCCRYAVSLIWSEIRSI